MRFKIEKRLENLNNAKYKVKIIYNLVTNCYKRCYRWCYSVTNDFTDGIIASATPDVADGVIGDV